VSYTLATAGCCTKYVLSAQHLILLARITKPSAFLKRYHFLLYEIHLYLTAVEVMNAFMDFYIYVNEKNFARQYVTIQSIVSYKILRVCAESVRD
jgi:hypothetical protein